MAAKWPRCAEVFRGRVKRVRARSPHELCASVCGEGRAHSSQQLHTHTHSTHPLFNYRDFGTNVVAQKLQCGPLHTHTHELRYFHSSRTLFSHNQRRMMQFSAHAFRLNECVSSSGWMECNSRIGNGFSWPRCFRIKLHPCAHFYHARRNFHMRSR